MPAPAYSEHEAAVHELGHAILACVLALDFEYVEIRPAAAPRNGWIGQCKPGPKFPKNQWVCHDAFQLGGPLLQLTLLPKSVGGYLPLFQPSLFSNTPELMGPKFDVLNELVWGTDLAYSYLLQSAPNSPKRDAFVRAYGEKPWLLELESHIRSFVTLPSVRTVVDALSPELAAAKRLAPTRVHQVFRDTVTPVEHEAVRNLVAQHIT